MRKLLSALALAVLGLTARVHADPLTPALLPEGTRWVLHADMDAGRAATPLWNLARQRIYESRRDELAPRLAIFERLTGMRPGQDLKDVTVYGSSYDESTACIRIHGIMDRQGVTDLLKADSDFRERPYGTRTILSWRDGGHDRTVYAAFAEGDLVFIAHNARAIEGALDLLDKKKTSLAADSALLPALGTAQPGKPIVWIAGTDLSDLPRAKKSESPVIAQMESASMGIRWINEKATLDLHIKARNEKAAEQLEAVAEGMKALVMLAAGDDHAPAGAKLLGSAFSQLKVTVEGREMRADWPIGLDKIEAIMDFAGRHQGLRGGLNDVAKPEPGPRNP